MKYFSGDSSLLKSINKSSILQIIRQDAPISRAALAKQTKLTRATVSALVEELMQDHLVIEIGTGESSGGRKPMLLEMNRDAGYVFGIDLRATEIVFVVTNMDGERIDKIVFRYEDAQSEQTTLQQIMTIVTLERSKLPASPLGLRGIGLGIHGFVEYPSNRILFVPYFGWKGADWKEKLEHELGLHVYLDNEANLAALGELEAGSSLRYSNLIYLSIGTGIGAGMILGGDIFRGNSGYAGEVGHTTIEFDGRPCPCGNRGCWEMYASEKALAKQLGLSYKPGITQTILTMLEQEQPRALHALMETGRSLAMGIGNMVHTFNPQLVVLGNQMGKYSKWLHPYIERTMAARFSLVHNDVVEVRYSELGDEACAIGAAHLTIRNLLRL